MSDWVKILEMLSNLGILPLVLLLSAMPLGLLLFFLFLRLYLFRGLGGYTKNLGERWLKDHEKRTQTETKLEERLADIAEQLKSLASGLTKGQDTMQSTVKSFEGIQRETLEVSRSILRHLPKRKED